jgi:hypothetical protein
MQVDGSMPDLSELKYFASLRSLTLKVDYAWRCEVVRSPEYTALL